MANRWMVSELFYPEEISTGYVMTKIAEKLSEEGEINVLCGPSEYDSKVFKSNKKLNEKIIIHRVSVPNLNKNNLLTRSIRMVLLSLTMASTIIRKVKSGDQLILVTNPATLLVIVSILKKFKSFEYVIIVHDVFPENLVPAGILSKYSIPYKIFYKIFNYAYSKADKLIAVGEDMKNLLLKKINKLIPIFVIQNWSDSEEIYLLDNFCISEYYHDKSNDKIYFQFAGNLGRVQGLEELFELFRQIDNPSIKFVFIGEGALKKQLIKIKEESNLSQVNFYSAKPRKEQLQFLNACHIGIIVLSEGMYGLGVPSKTYNILSASKPILFIGDKDSEIYLYIKENNVGWAFDWSEREKIIQFFNSLTLDDIDILKQKGKLARELVNKRFTKEIILNQFKNVLSK